MITTGRGSKHKRKRKSEHDQTDYKNDPPGTKPTMPTSTSSSAPQWAPSNPMLPPEAAIYGLCPNVSSYEKIGRIGEGTYGVVYQASDKKTRELVALKRCLPHHEASDGFPLTTLREITILKELQSEGGQEHGIIGLKDVTVSSSRSGVFLVFEYAQHDLANLVDNYYAQNKSSPFSQSEVKRLMQQLLKALRFLHSRYIIHRDLKMSNLLYNDRGELKVCDFGLARRVCGRYVGEDTDDNNDSRDCLTPKVVSLWYRPPEILFGSEYYDQGVDNWGAGCIMGELLKGRPVMDGRNEMDQLQQMFRVLGPPNFDDWPELKELPTLKNGEVEIPKRWHMQNNGRNLLDILRDWKCPSGMKLLMGLLKYNPSHRWTAEKSLAADYFSTLPGPTPLSLMPTFPTKHNT